jgi:SAM-dependent methyltransferase
MQHNSTSICSICNNLMKPFINNAQDPESKEIFLILQCTQCALEKTYPQPLQIESYYNKQYHGNRHGFTARLCMQRRLRWLNQSHEKGRLLDIGCGDGAFLQAAKQKGWEVYGTEINTMICKNTDITICTHLDDMQAYAPFKVITLWHSLEHLADPAKIISHINGLLASDGTLFIAVPNAQGWQARLFGKNWLHRDVPRHLYHFSPYSLSYLLSSAKFKIHKTWHQELEYDLMGWVQSTLNYLFSTPNIFFNMLTGRQLKITLLTKLLNWIGGIFFSLMYLPLLPIASSMGQGGTLIIAAKKERSQT